MKFVCIGRMFSFIFLLFLKNYKIFIINLILNVSIRLEPNLIESKVNSTMLYTLLIQDD
jgi:hypothetical protein